MMLLEHKEDTAWIQLFSNHIHIYFIVVAEYISQNWQNQEPKIFLLT